MDIGSDNLVDLVSRETELLLAVPDVQPSGPTHQFAPDPTISSLDDIDYKSRFERWTTTKSFDFSATSVQGTLLGSVSVADAFGIGERAVLVQVFRYYRFARVEVQLLVNSNEFNSGHLKGVLRLDPTSGDDIWQTKNGKHLFIHSANNIEMEIPWILTRNWVDRAMTDPTRFINEHPTLLFYSIVPFFAPSSENQTITIRVMTRIMGLQFKFPMAPQSLFLRQGEKTVQANDSVFYYPSTNKFMGSDPGQMLAGAYVPPNAAGLSEQGMATTAGYLLSQESLVETGTWKTTDDGTLKLLYVSPYQNSIATPGRMDNTMEMFASLSTFWTGGIDYIVRFSMTGFHTGKLRISKRFIGAVGETSLYPYFVVDLKKQNEFSFTVHNNWDYPLKRTYVGASLVENFFEHPDRVDINVMTPLRSTTGVGESITYTIWKRGSSINPLRFFSPSVVSGVDASGSTYKRKVEKVTQVLPESSIPHFELGFPEPYFDSTYGGFEELHDLMQLCTRANFFYDEVTPPVPENFFWKPIPVCPTQPGMFVRPGNALSLLSTLFRFWGGSMWYLVQTNTNVLELKIRPASFDVYGTSIDPYFSNFAYWTGGVKPTINIANTTSHVAATVPDVCPNRANVIIRTNPVDETGVAMKFFNNTLQVISYDSASYKNASVIQYYFGFGNDGWLSGYDGFGPIFDAALAQYIRPGEWFPPKFLLG